MKWGTDRWLHHSHRQWVSESRPGWRGGETWSTLMEATTGRCLKPLTHSSDWSVCSAALAPSYMTTHTVWINECVAHRRHHFTSSHGTKMKPNFSCLLELPRCLRSRDLRCSHCAAAGYIYVAVFKRLADGLTVTHEGKSNHITLMTKTHMWTCYSSIPHVTSLCGSCS